MSSNDFSVLTQTYYIVDVGARDSSISLKQTLSPSPSDGNDLYSPLPSSTLVSAKSPPAPTASMSPVPPMSSAVSPVPSPVQLAMSSVPPTTSSVLPTTPSVPPVSPVPHVSNVPPMSCVPPVLPLPHSTSSVPPSPLTPAHESSPPLIPASLPAMAELAIKGNSKEANSNATQMSVRAVRVVGNPAAMLSKTVLKLRIPPLPPLPTAPIPMVKNTDKEASTSENAEGKEVTGAATGQTSKSGKCKQAAATQKPHAPKKKV
ncbi:hypothetical protein PAXRUDRAFT_20543 [Paxillus rubicundulus Ve08.2h10]|uniref:Uncharacterized protein n=1 Tax=Paxillus rubicundulus Ve08.2h10 TaxID=930991 RepID=A0A0D0D1G9_9AGAM|nr:hypothetical protein PAXRUDRAFT_20543 [Paxillus rubicundulus Ve08.2h10]